MKDQKSYKVIFEDDDLVIVNKAAGLLAIPDRYDPKIPNLKNLLDKKYGEIFVVHRLDKDTSGITVFAKNELSHRRLSLDFQEAKIDRIYHALVEGVFPDEPLEIDIPIMVDPSKKGRSIPSAMGKASLTKIKLLDAYKRFSKVACKLETGRHHQIRVHLSAINYPLAVDNFYGNRDEFFVSEIKKNYNLKKDTEEKPLISRNTLHAFSLEFTHPTQKDKKVYFEAEYPKDIRALESVLGKYDKRFR
jgi:RluA family pseudouridine synthase